MTDENIAEISQNRLEYYAKNYRIFMDTCSLLQEETGLFFEHLLPVLTDVCGRNAEKGGDHRIILPTIVIKELRKHSHDRRNAIRRDRAIRMLQLIDFLERENLAEIRGEAGDIADGCLADPVFQYVFAWHRLDSRLLLITQDIGLAEDVLKLNQSKSAHAGNVLVKRINRYGYLSNRCVWKAAENMQPVSQTAS